MGIYEELNERGLIAQVTDEEQIRDLINKGNAKFYIGFDPTADSLHVGHFMTLVLAKRLQEAGNTPIILLGGATGYIGDPSGKSDMRTLMKKEVIDHNIACFKKQMERFIDFDNAILVNNADWLLNKNYIEFLREVGPYFSVNNMLRAECYKKRMENGLSFLEFNYMIMQAYDFYTLNRLYDCNMEFGGDDQWSNMLAGTELIRKKTGKDAYALTITLLTNKEGVKMGKTVSGAVWLDESKTNVYDFFQYWRNIPDDIVIKCFKLLTFVPLDKIKEMETWDDSRINEKKELLAFELTKLVHGEKKAKDALEQAHSLFSNSSNEGIYPEKEMHIENDINILDLLVLSGLCQSKSDARRLVEQGGITIDNQKISDPKTFYTLKQLKDGLNIKKGKKIYLKVINK